MPRKSQLLIPIDIKVRKYPRSLTPLPLLDDSMPLTLLCRIGEGASGKAGFKRRKNISFSFSDTSLDFIFNTECFIWYINCLIKSFYILDTILASGNMFFTQPSSKDGYNMERSPRFLSSLRYGTWGTQQTAWLSCVYFPDCRKKVEWQ